MGLRSDRRSDRPTDGCRGLIAQAMRMNGRLLSLAGRALNNDAIRSVGLAMQLRAADHLVSQYVRSAEPDVIAGRVKPR